MCHIIIYVFKKNTVNFNIFNLKNDLKWLVQIESLKKKIEIFFEKYMISFIIILINFQTFNNMYCILNIKYLFIIYEIISIQLIIII